jgi:outer membrane murein-binding lipoprotein Lpp
MIKLIEKLVLKNYRLKRKLEVMEAQAKDFNRIVEYLEKDKEQLLSKLKYASDDFAQLKKGVDDMKTEAVSRKEFDSLMNEYTAVLFENKRLKALIDGEIESITEQEIKEHEQSISNSGLSGTHSVSAPDAIAPSNTGDRRPTEVSEQAEHSA